MKKLTLIIFLITLSYGEILTLKDVKKRIKNIKIHQKNYHITQKRVSSGSADGVVKFFKDKKGRVRKLVVEIEHDDGTKEFGKYLYSKNAKLLFSSIKTKKGKCVVRVKNFFGNDGARLILLERKRKESRGCEKISKEEVVSFPYLPKKLKNPNKISKIVREL